MINKPSDRTPNGRHGTGPQSRAARILVVDDQEFIVHVVCEILAEAGYSGMLAASSGSVALEKLEDNHVDLVISDLSMDHGNGLELVQAIRCGRAGIPANTPVVILTGLSDDRHVGYALLLDVNAFLIKPITPGRLLEKVERALSDRFEPRPKLAYRAVPTTIAGEPPAPEAKPPRAGRVMETADWKPGAGAPEAAEKTSRKPDVPPNARRVPIRQLQAGMTVASPILGPHEGTLIGGNTVLTKSMITRLNDLALMLEEDAVWILDQVTEEESE